MKVLVAHNRYRSGLPSGENKVVEAEIALLRSGGVEVIPFIETSDSIPAGWKGMLEAAPGPIYSRSGVARVEAMMARYRPDILHIHNVYPLISPWVIRVAEAAGVPVVQTAHNYRHSCVNGQHFRNGHVCVECVGSERQLPGLIHGCYRDSRIQTLPMTISQNVHKSTWRGVRALIALTPFMRDRLLESGFRDEQVHVRHSWVPDPGKPSHPGEDVLFVGRLDQPKGIEVLLNAWTSRGWLSGRSLRVVGEGPLAGKVRDVASTDRNIHFMGARTADEVGRLMNAAAFVVVPSLWYEGYPLVVAEARSRGRGVLTLEGGSVASIVGNGSGWAVPASQFAEALGNIVTSDAVSRGQLARRLYERENTPEVALERLLHIYQCSAMKSS